MAYPIYSVLLAAATIPAEATVLYTTPGDTTAVIRDICLTNVGDASDVIELLANVSGSPEVIFWRPASTVQLVTLHWEGRAVIPAGGQVISASNSLEWEILMSGYELT